MINDKLMIGKLYNLQSGSLAYCKNSNNNIEIYDKHHIHFIKGDTKIMFLCKENIKLYGGPPIAGKRIIKNDVMMTFLCNKRILCFFDGIENIINLIT